MTDPMSSDFGGVHRGPHFLLAPQFSTNNKRLRIWSDYGRLTSVHPNGHAPNTYCSLRLAIWTRLKVSSFVGLLNFQN